MDMENLVIIKKQVANIEWNKEQALKEANDIMAKYDGIVFTEEQLPQAKKEIATLRKVSKEINSQALAIDKELTLPVKQFRNEVKEVKLIVDNGIHYINEQIKEFEQKQKDERKAEIMLFDEYKEIEEFVPFKEEWLLKKWNDKALKIELSDIKLSLNTSIKSIESTCGTLNLDSYSYIEKLKQMTLDEVFARINEDYELLSSSNKQTDPVVIDNTTKLITITRTITGTESQLIALKEYALNIGCEYK